MTADFTIERVDHTSPLITDAARLHATSLPDTITSHRGVSTLTGIYRRLIRTGHSLYIARSGNSLVGGVMVMVHGRRRASFFTGVYRPWSWMVALRQLGLMDLSTQLHDLTQVMRVAAGLAPHDYIVALYVDASARRHGIARKLIERVSNEAAERGVGLGVDTLLGNTTARNFYRSVGFSDVAVTSRSQILTWARE